MGNKRDQGSPEVSAAYRLSLVHRFRGSRDGCDPLDPCGEQAFPICRPPRALGLLETLPHDGIAVIGIVYSAEAPDERALAAQAAERLSAIRGPNSTNVRAEIIAVDGLAGFANRLNGLFLLPGVLAESAVIILISTAGNIGGTQMSTLARTLEPACKEDRSETVERLIAELSNASAGVIQPNSIIDRGLHSLDLFHSFYPANSSLLNQIGFAGQADFPT